MAPTPPPAKGVGGRPRGEVKARGPLDRPRGVPITGSLKFRPRGVDMADWLVREMEERGVRKGLEAADEGSIVDPRGVPRGVPMGVETAADHFLLDFLRFLHACISSCM